MTIGALGTIAGLILAIAAVQILRVNTRLLPKELQPPLWRKAALLVSALFYAAVFVLAMWQPVEKMVRGILWQK